MNEQPRIRRISKWTGLVVCVLIVVTWVISVRGPGGYVGTGWAAGVGHGVFFVQVLADNQRFVTKFGPAPIGFFIKLDNKTDWLKEGWPLVTSHTNPVGRRMQLPLWLPLFILAIPTAILFYRDRRRIPPGHCQKCGYNLMGNESGICPECGTGIQKRA